MFSTYPAKLAPDTNGKVLVTFPDVPEAVTDAADRNSAIEPAAEALSLALSFYVESGRPLPVPSKPKRGQVLIQLPAGTIAKLCLYEAMMAQGITQSELARRLGCHRQHAARIVDPAHNTKFEVLEAALAAVGKRVNIVIEDAA